jgi:hypothetical protein
VQGARWELSVRARNLLDGRGVHDLGVVAATPNEGYPFPTLIMCGGVFRTGC